MILEALRRRDNPIELRKYGYTDPAKVRLFQFVAHAAGVVLIFIGILVLLGWYLDISRLRSFIVDYPAMRASTAIAFISAGIFVHLAVTPPLFGAKKRVYSGVRAVAAFIVLVLGLIRMWGFMTGYVIDVDNIVLGIPIAAAGNGSDRFIPNTPFFFIVLGLAMLFYDFRIRGVYYSQLFVILAGLVTMLMFISYIYQIDLVPGAAVNAALPTLLSYVLLIVALLCARPNRQVMDILTKDSAGGYLVRRLILFAIILPLLVGWIILLGFRLGLYNSDFRYLLVVSTLITLFIILIWENAQSLHLSDIERRETEQELLESQKKFSALAESNVIGVVLADLDGIIYEANTAFLQLIGYTRNDLAIGEINWRTLTASEYKKIVDAKNRQLVAKGKVKQYEKEFVKKDGSRVPVIVGKTLLNREHGIFIAFILDITERKRLEERKDEFISIASHELKTPLTSIKGYTQLLERLVQGTGNAQAGLLLSKTNTYIDRLSGLIADLLDVSKIQSGKLLFNVGQFDLYDLVKESIEGIQNTANNHTIELKQTTHQIFRGDKFRLEQVLHNLLTNAIKYSPRATRIVVRLTKNAKVVTLSVQDFGVGIPAKHLSKLFSRFYRVETTAKEFSGLGIGLYISSEIVKRHGGRIRVQSTEGKGSTFIVELPLNRLTKNNI